jgi:hypothetical protein
MLVASLRLLAVLVVICSIGCEEGRKRMSSSGVHGKDGGTDSGEPVEDSGRQAEDGGRQPEPEPECFHAEDGHPCGRDRQHICLQEQCVESACGDDFIDQVVGEECEGDGAGGVLCIDCKLCAGEACEQDPPSPCPPGQVVSAEVCNSIDDDCDGFVDEGVTIARYQDADADGYGNPTGESSVCAGSAGYAAQAGDCDDSDPLQSPGATEVCDALDNDCDALIDEGSACACTHGVTIPCGPSDGLGGIETRGQCEAGTQTCSAGSFGACEGAVGPATEICDAIDQDCDGAVDEGLTTTCWADADGDGFAAPGATQTAVCGSCGVGGTAQEPTGASIDCNDANGSVKPGSVELCNGVDDNCANGVDEGCP